MIAHLRDRYRDIVHPLDRLEIAFPRAKVRMEYVDRGNEGKKGAFRVHPRLPVLQIWPDIETGRRLLRDMASVEGEIVQRIHMQERLRDAKEAIVMSRARGEPPRRDDWRLVQESQIPPLMNSRRVDRDLEGRTIILKDIERSITSERRELLRRRRILPKEAVEIRLKSDVPVKLKPTIEVRLWVQFI